MSGKQKNMIFEDLKELVHQLGKYDEVTSEEMTSTIKKSIVEDSHCLDVTDGLGRTLLHLAVAKENKDLVKILIDSGYNINVKDHLGMTPLLTSILYNDMFDVSKLLLEANAETDITSGRFPLQIALNTQVTPVSDVVRYFYENLKRKGASSEQIGQQFLKARCSLVHAVYAHDSFMTRTILEGKRSIDVRESRDATKLAMEVSTLENVHTFLHYGLGVIERKVAFCRHLCDGIGRSDAKLKLAKPFVDKLIPWNIIVGDSVKHFQLIFRKAPKQAIELLLEYKIDVYVKETLGKDLLLYLCGNSEPDIIEILRSRKIDVNARVEKGYSLLHLAMKKSKVEIVQYLLNKGADPNAMNMSGFTPLLVRCNKLKCIELLLEHGADVQMLNAIRKTVFDIYLYETQALKILLAELAVVEARGTAIKSRVRKAAANAMHFNWDSDEFYNSLCTQIGEMKEYKIFGSFTFFDVLVRRPENVADYIRDGDVLSSILHCCEDKKWQDLYYISKIKINVSRALEIIHLRKKAVLVIHSCTDHLFSPDHLVLELIVSFLTYKDLRVFA